MPRFEHDGKPVDPDHDPLYRKRAAWKQMKKALDKSGHHLTEILVEFEKAVQGCPRLFLAVVLRHWLDNLTAEEQQLAFRSYWQWCEARKTGFTISAVMPKPEFLGWEVIGEDAWVVKLSPAPLLDGEGMAVGFELDPEHHVICLSPAVAEQHRDTALATAIERIREDATRGDCEAV